MPVPPQVPVVKFFSPSKSDQGLVEFHNTSVAAYLPLDLGVPHPSTREYPNFKLGKQFNLPNDEKWIARVWVKDQPSPEFWNWSEKFVSESNSHPIFIRTYREPRNTYTPKTKGQPLTAVYKLTLTLAGTGYTPGTLPALTFAGGGGSGAVGHAVINQDGTVAELVLDNGGTGYTSAPTFTVAAPPSGTTATGTAFIQPTTAVLVSEEAQPFPEDSEFFGLYLNVVRVYRATTGPALAGQDFDFKWGTPRPFVIQEQPAGTGGATEVTPIDTVLERAKYIDYATAIAGLLEVIIVTPGVASRVDLPDILSGITLVYEFSKGSGDYREDGTTEGVTQLGRSLTAAGRSQGSASVLPSVIPNLIRTTARNIDTKQCVFFLENPVTDAQVRGALATLISTGTTVTVTIASPAVMTWTAHGLSNGDPIALTTSGALPTGLAIRTIYYVINKTADTFQLSLTQGGSAINTSGSQSGTHKAYLGVTSWKQFDQQEHDIIITGKHVSLSVDTKAHVATASDNILEKTLSQAKGFSSEVGTVVRETHIGECIHGEITIAVDSNNPTIDPIEVISKSVVGSVGDIWDPIVSVEMRRTDSVGFSVRPHIIPATQITTIPSQGFHIIHSDGEPYLTALDTNTNTVRRIIMIRADVVDLSQILQGASTAGVGIVGTPIAGITNNTPGTTSIGLGGYVIPCGFSTVYSWEYGLTPAYGSTDTGATISTDLYTKTTVTKTITGLTTGTEYHFRLKAVNSLGTTYSADVKVTTS